MLLYDDGDSVELKILPPHCIWGSAGHESEEALRRKNYVPMH